MKTRVVPRSMELKNLMAQTVRAHTVPHTRPQVRGPPMLPTRTHLWVIKARLPCYPSRGQQVSHQKWIWGPYCMHARKHTSEGSTLPLKPRVDGTGSIKQRYQCSHKNYWCPPDIFKKKLEDRWSNNHYFLEIDETFKAPIFLSQALFDNKSFDSYQYLTTSTLN